MKKLFLGLMLASALMACNSSGNKDAATEGDTTTTTVNANAPVMKFEVENHDFGKVKAGEKVTYEFKFTNTGQSPLIISSATATCGCTVPEWPKAPLQPGAGGVIKVTFDSANKEGLQDKQITVTANTSPAQNVVHLVGEVLK